MAPKEGTQDPGKCCDRAIRKHGRQRRAARRSSASQGGGERCRSVPELAIGQNNSTDLQSWPVRESLAGTKKPGA